MFQNCYKFNPEDSLVHTSGKSLEEEFNRYWKKKPSLISEDHSLRTTLKSSSKLAKLPGLFYEDTYWSEEEQSEWFDTAHVQRCNLLDIRNHNIPVLSALPIALAKSSTTGDSPTIDVNTASSVLLYLSASPQIGFKHELLHVNNQLKRMSGVRPGLHQTWGFISSCTDAELVQKIKVDGIGGLARRLPEMFQDGEKWACVSIKDVIDTERFILKDAKETPATKKRKAT